MDKNVNLNLNVRNRSLLDALDELQGDLVELEPLEAKAARATTEFQDALEGLDRVLQLVDDDELVFARHVQELPQAVAKVGEAAKKAEKDVAGIGRAMLNASQSAQDLAQGGFAAILNNMPKLTEDAAKYIPWVNRLSTAFGGPLGLAAASTGVGVAFVAMTPLVQKGYAALAKGVEEVPKSADALERMNGEIKANKKAMEDMEESWRGTAAEVEAYNRKLEDNARLEKEVNAERERRQKFEALRKKSEEGKLDKDAGEIASQAIDDAGGPEELRRMLAEQLGRESAVSQAAFKELQRAAAEKDAAQKDVDIYAASGVDTPTDVLQRIAAAAKALGDAQARLNEAGKQAQARAEKTIVGASSGDQAAIAELARRFPSSNIGQATTADMARQAREVSDVDAEGQRLHEAGVKRRAAKAEAEADAKSEAIYNKSIADHEAALTKMDGEVKRQEAARRKRDQAKAAADARKAKAAADKTARENTPAARLRAQREAAYQGAAGIAMDELGGQFTPAQLDSIARDAAENAGGLDYTSLRDAVARGAGMMQMRIQQQLNNEMQRLWQGGQGFIQ